MPGSPSHSSGSLASCPNPLFSGIVSSFLLSFLASRLDLISLPKTRSIFFYLFWHRVQIPLAFYGSVPGSFSPSDIMAMPLASLWLYGDKIVGHLNSSLEFISLIHCLHFAFVTHSFIHFIEEGHICRPSILSLDTCILSYGCHMNPCFHTTPPWPPCSHNHVPFFSGLFILQGTFFQIFKIFINRIDRLASGSTGSSSQLIWNTNFGYFGAQFLHGLGPWTFDSLVTQLGHLIKNIYKTYDLILT